MKYIEGVGEMPNSQAGDVEALRRELADLIVQWAGKSVKDDPDSPLGAALTRAVRDAAREAVSEQHQALSRRDAEGIAEAVARLGAEQRSAGGVMALPQKTLLALCAVAVAVAALTFVIGMQVGRAGAALDAAAEPALAAAAVTPFAPPSATIAPQAPAAEPAPRRPAPVETAAARPPATRPLPTRSAVPASQPARRAAPSGPVGRPAATAPTDTGGQPVTGARVTPPAAAATPPASAAAP